MFKIIRFSANFKKTTLQDGLGCARKISPRARLIRIFGPGGTDQAWQICNFDWLVWPWDWCFTCLPDSLSSLILTKIPCIFIGCMNICTEYLNTHQRRYEHLSEHMHGSMNICIFCMVFIAQYAGYSEHNQQGVQNTIS
jgi:hypothetical protein